MGEDGEKWVNDPEQYKDFVHDVREKLKQNRINELNKFVDFLTQRGYIIAKMENTVTMLINDYVEESSK